MTVTQLLNCINCNTCINCITCMNCITCINCIICINCNTCIVLKARYTWKFISQSRQGIYKLRSHYWAIKYNRQSLFSKNIFRFWRIPCRYVEQTIAGSTSSTDVQGLYSVKTYSSDDGRVNLINCRSRIILN